MKRALLLVLAVSWLAQPALAGDFDVPFESVPKHRAIVVEARVNGRPVRLLVDTGSARTVLSPEVGEVSHVELAVSRFSDRGPGYHGEAVGTQATIRLGKHTWYDHRVVVMDLKEVRRLYGSDIDGLLGQDLLSDFDRVVIDFKAHTLHLTQ